MKSGRFFAALGDDAVAAKQSALWAQFRNAYDAYVPRACCNNCPEDSEEWIGGKAFKVAMATVGQFEQI